MNESDRYAKIVEWSEEDQCFVGTAPGLVFGGCHGSDEKAVREELDQIVDEAIALYEQDDRPLPA
jgi:predicted RNase H-like HicB family nuclease